MHTLRSRDDLLPPDEDVKGVAIAGVLRVWHGVEGPNLHLHSLFWGEASEASTSKARDCSAS